MKSETSKLSDPRLAALVGTPVDIASSAYLYRADRKAEENPPESWFALMRYAGLPFDKPADVNTPAIKQALCGLLWEEILLRLRHPQSAPIKRVTVNGKAWKDFDPDQETIELTGVTGPVVVRVSY